MTNMVLDENPAAAELMIKTSQNGLEETDGGVSSSHTHVKYVTDLAQRTLSSRSLRKAKAMFQSNEMYIWFIIMMGVSYGIPALQLVLKGAINKVFLVLN